MRLLPLLTIISLLPACEDTVHTQAVEDVSRPLEPAVVYVVVPPAEEATPEESAPSEPPADPDPAESDDGEDEGEVVDDEGHTSDDTSDEGQPDEEADALVWASYDCDGHAQALFAIVHLAGKSGAYDEESANAFMDITGKLIFIDYRDTLFADMPDYCMEVASDEWMGHHCFGLTADRKWVETAYVAENSAQHDALYMNWYDSYVPIVDGERVYPGCE